MVISTRKWQAWVLLCQLKSRGIMLLSANSTHGFHLFDNEFHIFMLQVKNLHGFEPCCLLSHLFELISVDILDSKHTVDFLFCGLKVHFSSQGLLPYNSFIIDFFFPFLYTLLVTSINILLFFKGHLK